MLSIIAGTVLLAIVHALIPNHWLPLVAVAKAEGWKQKEVTTVTFFGCVGACYGNSDPGNGAWFYWKRIKGGIRKDYLFSVCRIADCFWINLFHCKSSA